MISSALFALIFQMFKKVVTAEDLQQLRIKTKKKYLLKERNYERGENSGRSEERILIGPTRNEF
jgi:hypothetical protein